MLDLIFKHCERKGMYPRGGHISELIALKELLPFLQLIDLIHPIEAAQGSVDACCHLFHLNDFSIIKLSF
ncbi:hypothetical protein D3C84_1000750 [compost metagenome]